MRSFHFLDHTTLSYLEEALPLIELDAIDRVETRTPYKFWTYRALAELAGVEADWAYPGRIRVNLSGGTARAWIRKNYRLWWTADHRGGITFTANPRIGLSWDRERIGERVWNDARYLVDAAKAAEIMQPLFRPDYLELQAAAEKMVKAASKLLKHKEGTHGEGEAPRSLREGLFDTLTGKSSGATGRAGRRQTNRRRPSSGGC